MGVLARNGWRWNDRIFYVDLDLSLPSDFTFACGGWSWRNPDFNKTCAHISAKGQGTQSAGIHRFDSDFGDLCGVFGGLHL